MAQYVPEIIKDATAEISESGLKLGITLPHKTFSSGKKGFFKMGMLTVGGKKYRINLQVYEIEK